MTLTRYGVSETLNGTGANTQVEKIGSLPVLQTARYLVGWTRQALPLRRCTGIAPKGNLTGRCHTTGAPYNNSTAAIPTLSSIGSVKGIYSYILKAATFWTNTTPVKESLCGTAVVLCQW